MTPQQFQLVEDLRLGLVELMTTSAGIIAQPIVRAELQGQILALQAKVDALALSGGKT